MLEQPTGIQMPELHPRAEAVSGRIVDLGRAGIVHDLNNLLTPVIWILGSLQEKHARSPMECQRIEGAIACAERARALVRQLSDIPANRQPNSSMVQIAELLMELEPVLLCTLGPRITLVLNITPALPTVRLDRDQIERALLNLIVNAREAMPNGGTVTISAYTEFRSAGLLGQAEVGLHVSICDTGIGMDALTLRQAGEPLFSTKPNGSGLGLAVTRDLIGRLNGDMTITSFLGIGTTIDIWLPAAKPSAQSASDRYA